MPRDPDQLKVHEEVKSLYRRSPELARQLDHCCDLLCRKYPNEGDERLAKGIAKAHHAMKHEYKVFISYKRVEHAVAATKIYRVLEGLGAGKIMLSSTRAVFLTGINGAASWPKSLASVMR